MVFEFEDDANKVLEFEDIAFGCLFRFLRNEPQRVYMRLKGPSQDDKSRKKKYYACLESGELTILSDNADTGDVVPMCHDPFEVRDDDV